MRKSRFWLMCSFLIVFSACSFSQSDSVQELRSDVPENVQVMMTDISDQMLQSTVKSLPQNYQAKPQNQVFTISEILSSLKVKKILKLNLPFENMVPGSAQKIGDEIYFILKQINSEGEETYQIFQNRAPVFVFQTESTASYSPIISVRVIVGIYTVEYVTNHYDAQSNTIVETQKIWQAGIGDLGEKYGLENAIMPFEVSGKLIFLAEKEQKWFVVFDETKISEDFERIDFGYCCEPANFKPRSFGYRYYTFFATQDKKQKLVEIDLGSN